MSDSSIAPHQVALDEENVAQFLANSPEFFLRHPELLSSLTLPHEEHGTVSLVQMQMQRQRQKISQLEEEITQLMSIATHNEKISRTYGDLYPELVQAESLVQLVRILGRVFREQLRLNAFAIKLDTDYFDLPAQHAIYSLDKSTLDGLRAQRIRNEEHYFGRIDQADKNAIFGEKALVNSVALIELGEQGCLGILAVGSANANHFVPEMDTLLLDQLCHIVAILLPRLVKVKTDSA
ncbi:DUF484 family protein [Motilimonas cestriensis]|uniref:DUF484 family protein n=1 Tax=Motilimonas cestriensis TaxID=2742685 RepID=A0ABS8WCW5_9GAMM|nr:DUF484 family protein [Motilimonas cestriensis]MCE2596115.1 DUF484 family protein [Motilimonas cestriensis]